MHHVPVGRHAVDRRILVHRRHHDAIGQRHAAQPERLEHRRARASRCRPRSPAPASSRATTLSVELDELRRAQRQIVVGDRLRARHQPEGEARRVHVPEALDVLEPDERHVGGMLGLLDLLAPRRSRSAPARSCTSRPPVKRNASYSAMASSIASLVPEPIEKCAVALASPISTMLSAVQLLAADGREIPPQRAVGDQLVAGELVGEHAFEEVRRRRLVELVEAGALEGLRIGLHHPGRAAGLVLIAMRDEDAVRRLLEEEIEGVHRPRRAHPGELVGPQLDARLERVLEQPRGCAS